jgi:hypothetical protein
MKPIKFGSVDGIELRQNEDPRSGRKRILMRDDSPNYLARSGDPQRWCRGSRTSWARAAVERCGGGRSGSGRSDVGHRAGLRPVRRYEQSDFVGCDERANSTWPPSSRPVEETGR